MFKSYNESYKDLKRLREIFDNERKEVQEIAENNDITENILLDDENSNLDNLDNSITSDNERWSIMSMKGDSGDDEDNVSLYENSNISLKCFVTELMNAKIKGGVSDRAHELYLSVIKKALPQPNRLLITLNGTRNYLKKESTSLSDEAIYQELTNGNFVIYNARRRIDEILRMYTKEIISYTEEMLSSSQLNDTICGQIYRGLHSGDKNSLLIGLQLHFDGANFNQTNKTHQMFPISLRILNLPMGIRNKFKFYIPLVIYYGIGKPPLELMEGHIKESFKRFKLFNKDSIMFNGKKINYNVQIINFTADIIAKHDFLMIKHFRHTYGCSLCLTPCVNVISRPVYPSANGCTLRTRNSIIDDVNYVVLNKPLIESYHGHRENLPVLFENIMYPYTITVDWFHSVLEGSFHNDLNNILISGFNVNNDTFLVPPLKSNYKDLFDYVVDNNKISRCFARRPRRLEFFGSYKASEMRLIFLYIFPSSMCSIINTGDRVYSRYVLNIFLQISAVGSLLNSDLTIDFVDVIEEILFKWHQKRIEIISKNHNSTVKCHEVTHLPHVVKYHGPINAYSTFAGESSLHDIHSLLSSLSLENVLTQITKRLDDRWYCYKNKTYSIADLKDNIITIQIPDSIQAQFDNEMYILKNTNCLSKLSNRKILEKIYSNLERSTIDQDSYVYIKESDHGNCLPYIVEYILLDKFNNIFFATKKIISVRTIENYLVHDDIETVNLIKQTNFFKKYFEVEKIDNEMKIFDARHKKISFIKGICIKTQDKNFICPLNSYEHN